MFLTVPLLDPEYSLSTEEEIPPRAIIGNVPLDIQTLQGTSGRLVALEVTDRNAAFVAPRLSPGDIVIIDLEDREPPSSGSSELIFLFRTRRGDLLSRCIRKDRLLILTPVDPSTVPEVLEHPGEPSASPLVLGRVVWSARRYSQ